MKQKSACKIKTVLSAIVFAVMEIPILFALCNSSAKMYKNAMLAGWIEFQEEKKDA